MSYWTLKQTSYPSKLTKKSPIVGAALKEQGIMCQYDVEEIHAQIRHKVKLLRERKGKSQLEMALAIGHSSAAFYAKAELGIQNKKFNVEHLCKIANVLEVDVRDFFDTLRK
jgi:DNA-binding XRE family transcriptional regulator